MPRQETRIVPPLFAATLDEAYRLARGEEVKTATSTSPRPRPTTCWLESTPARPSTNTIGAAELGAVWSDPDFAVGQKAFYYARVIEIPTPRWSTYDAFRFGIPVPEGAPTSTQERAYTSPIWYAPDRP
jgi:hypothetical protein